MSISRFAANPKWVSLLIAFCVFNRAKGAPSVFSLGCPLSHLKMQKTIQKDTRWRKREGERRDTMDCFLNGKSKEKNRREMNGEEGETKQGALSFRNEKNKKEEL